MNVPVSTYQLPTGLSQQVDAYRASKIARLDDVLRALDTNDDHPWSAAASADLPLRYALAHQVFEAASRAVQDQDTEAIGAAMMLRSEESALDPIQTDAGPIVVLHPAWAALTDDAALDEDAARTAAPVAIASAELHAAATAADRDLVRRALGSAVAAGFGSTVARNTRVVALIAELRPTAAKIRSWTTTSLPATAHLDYFAEQRYVSRELIHEAAHTELNDLFAASGIADDLRQSTATFYAPWLETERPAFGFLHGTWAFSHVALYCRWLLDADVTPEISAVADMMHTRHVKQIHATRQDFARAVELVRVPELAELITQRRDAALEGASSPVNA
ncbi:aKG-HExxH-type peptide beta-hydroxylase [Amycolatopsis sp. EV170708-02-1]|uniref:aKG-HExxH-type peptide beta-hydroxylase n=1 Tax=Amycolatopsis sp. EV170708-02-1 TaxID=2919322 RepID=UPI001F0BED8F|nr:HEXXH motif-containing putative peptide modification protein [Amycolatopsis sp. EV170708-02-1]UMP06999.1 HEXXH motif-containing putative peptide modification protein [Amycolatopsis sp. EV170708-02-1]